MTRVIAIDFDGTLFENKWPDIGAANWWVINAAKYEQRQGSKLILWTNRTGEHLKKALQACEKVGLEFDAVNESLPEWVSAFNNDPRKIGATEYWDDKALSVPDIMRREQARVLREEKSLPAVAPKLEEVTKNETL